MEGFDVDWLSIGCPALPLPPSSELLLPGAPVLDAGAIADLRAAIEGELDAPRSELKRHVVDSDRHYTVFLADNTPPAA